MQAPNTHESREDAQRPVERLVVRRVECCSCGWTGTEDEQKRIDSPSLKKMGVAGWDHVCPKCAHDEFYQL